jgi:allophanate hydrolase
VEIDLTPFRAAADLLYKGPWVAERLASIRPFSASPTGPEGGIEVEVWELTAAGFGSLVAAVPAPLAVGTVTLEDGEPVKGFLCEAHAVQGAEDISAWGGWRAYRARPGGNR